MIIGTAIRGERLLHQTREIAGLASEATVVENKPMETADELYDGILTGKIDPDDNANKLLKEFFGGFPLEKLRLLLRSEREEVVKAGVFIASELAAKASPLLNDIVPLLKHESHHVRFDAIDAILTCSMDDGDAVVGVVRLLGDPHSGVRRKVIRFLMAVGGERIGRALARLDPASDTDSPLAAGLREVLKSETASDDAILSLLKSDSPLLRRFGLAAALRGPPRSEQLRQTIETSEDAEVRDFGRELLDSQEWERQLEERRKESRLRGSK